MSNYKKKYIESEWKSLLEITNMIDKDNRSYLDGVYGTRRQEAILKYLDKAESDFKDYGFSSTMEIFTKNELLPFSNYNHLDDDCDIRIGAALWILEKLRAANCLSKVFPHLQEVYEWYLPDSFYHPCFSYDLIQAMIHMITTRYKGAGSIITEGNAGRKKPGKEYQNIIELIPEEEKEKACASFKSKLWEITTRFMKGEAYYYRKIKEKNEQIDATPFSGNNVLLNNQPVGSAYIADRPMGFVNFLMKEEMELPTLGAPKIDLMQEKHNLVEKEHTFTTEFKKFLGEDRKTIRKFFGNREVTDAIDGFTVDDPYELCFALIYLLDSGDDIPWLMFSGSALMLYVIKVLPWFVSGEDWNDEDWDEWYEGVPYNRNNWLEEEPIQEESDYYNKKYAGKNLAQIIYGMCRGVVPIGLHPFERDRRQLVEDGMDEETARKVTDTATLLFLSDLQAKQPVLYDDYFDEEPEEETDQEQQVEEDSGVDDTEAELEKAKADIKSLRTQLKSLQQELATTRQAANKELAKTEHELKTLRMEHRELADLRELVFNQENEVREELTKDYSYPYKTVKRTVIFGGHDTFLKAIRQLLPEVKYVDASNLNFNPDVIRYADVVWIQRNCISHPQYWSVVKNCKLAGVQMRYFSYASAEKCAEQLVEWDRK